jgi:phenylpropionate dioxygenase-like ring-hydroxylating dioxygenase large terminal subunit
MTVSASDNELMTRVTGDAPMGTFLRENFWFPAILTQQLVSDGPPMPVRLLGVNYVAFRSTDGRVGFFAEACPHRGTSLLLARNEDNALRCIFHGWKFRVDGACVEVPTQPDNHEAYCATVPVRHYPAREAAGIVWVWLGKGTPPRFPEFEFTGLPANQVRATSQTLKFNWIQSLEGLVDSAHVSVLHQDWLDKAGGGTTALGAAAQDRAPVYEFENKPGGFRYAAIRKAGEGKRYIRVTEYVAPFYCFIPFSTGNCAISVPIDDRSTALYFVQWNVEGSVPVSAYGPTTQPANFPPYLKAGREGRWGQDRDAMRRDSFTGFREHLMLEDFSVAESQGTIADRSNEFLNVGDRGIMLLRRLLIDGARQTINGDKSTLANHEAIPYPTIRAHAAVVPESTQWKTFFN